MSLATQIGREGNVFEMTPDNARQVMLNSPVLSQRKLRQLLVLPEFVEAHVRLDLYLLRGRDAAGSDCERLCREAEAAVRDGCVLLLLSDRFPEPRLPADPCPAGHRRDPSAPGRTSACVATAT